MKKLIFVILLCAIGGFIYLFNHSPTITTKTNHISKNKLVFGIHPYLEKKTLIGKFQPLVDYLAKALNKTITLEISPSYTEHLKRVGSDYYDFAYIGPSTYIDMVEEYGLKTILASMTTHSLAYFNGIIFVRSDSSIYSLKDLKGKTFAFGKASSTMSSRIPIIMLEEAGVKLSDFKSYQHLNNHEEVVVQVLESKFNAGAVKESIFDQYKQHGLREIARSRHVAEHVFVASDKLNKNTQLAIEKLLLSITDTQQGKQILFKIKPKSKSLQPTTDEAFNSLREYLDIHTHFEWNFEYGIEYGKEQIKKALNVVD